VVGPAAAWLGVVRLGKLRKITKSDGIKLFEEFERGKTPLQLIRKKKASKNTVYKYWKKYLKYKEMKKLLWEILINESPGGYR
jgi:DNA invertase Pin-like site-specific DNA recombinase